MICCCKIARIVKFSSRDPSKLFRHSGMDFGEYLFMFYSFWLNNMPMLFCNNMECIFPMNDFGMGCKEA